VINTPFLLLDKVLIHSLQIRKILKLFYVTFSSKNPL